MLDATPTLQQKIMPQTTAAENTEAGCNLSMWNYEPDGQRQ